MKPTSYTRRRLLAGATAAAALAPLGVRAQAFPSKNIRVVIPTGQGGGAERLARSFDEVWAKLLKTNFEHSFYAGAAGQVGYETFVHKREKDAYNLLFGNMGPEMIMYALQKPNYRFPEDFQYFCRTDIDDSVVFALRKGGLDANAITVGRGTWCDIRLPHPSVSRCHAFFSRVGDRFQITDNGSENGTFLSRKQLVAGRPAVVRPGQIIQLGDVRLVYLPAIRFVQYLAAESTNPINRVDRIEMRR